MSLSMCQEFYTLVDILGFMLACDYVKLLLAYMVQWKPYVMVMVERRTILPELEQWITPCHYHPCMRVGNVFSHVCVYVSVCVFVCVSVYLLLISICQSFVCSYRLLKRSRSHIKVKVASRSK